MLDRALEAEVIFKSLVYALHLELYQSSEG